MTPTIKFQGDVNKVLPCTFPKKSKIHNIQTLESRVREKEVMATVNYRRWKSHNLELEVSLPYALQWGHATFPRRPLFFGTEYMYGDLIHFNSQVVNGVCARSWVLFRSTYTHTENI